MQTEQLVLLIPIIGTVLGISLAMLAIYFEHTRKTQLLNQVHAERMAAIEKGIEPPPASELLSQLAGHRDDGSSPARRRASGLILLLLGAAITFALWMTGNFMAWWGLVPSAIGAALLISSYLDTRDQHKTGLQGPPSEGTPPAA